MGAGNDTARERLIVALDFGNRDDALALVEKLDGAATFFKVGYELFVAEGMGIVHTLREMGCRIFLDLKMDDVEETVRRAVGRIASENGIVFLTLHGYRATAAAAAKGRGGRPLKLLQVTMLTSLGSSDLQDLMLVGENRRFKSVEEYVEWRADVSLQYGCDGLIASGQSVAALRRRFGPGPVLVCPGIRPASDGTDEHKRASTPYDAIASGGDYLVVGRPIRNAPDPKAKAMEIVEEIQRGLDARA